MAKRISFLFFIIIFIFSFFITQNFAADIKEITIIYTGNTAGQALPCHA
ncbi:MAG: hypothetical protein JRI44_07640 [Deltaproteobacteria bacterium]|nr:hypothetical protein [Deltaproteobacteria bacterium]